MPFWDKKTTKEVIIIKHISTPRNVRYVANLRDGAIFNGHFVITNLLLNVSVKNKNPDFCWDSRSYCVWIFFMGEFEDSGSV